MIDQLHVTDVALIEDATIIPGEGLTVLTGETGAGKTALLAALKLLVGERADTTMVREGADQLSVEGRVIAPDADDPDGIVVRRSVSTAGRSRVEIDGRMASVRELAEAVGTHVDLCGQHEHQRLLNTATHIDLLDAYAADDLAAPLEAYGRAWEQDAAARAEFQRLQELATASAERVDAARFALARIDEVGPVPGELDELEGRLARAEHAEALLRAAATAHAACASDGGAQDALYTATNALEQVADHDDTLAAARDRLSSALIEVEDVARDLAGYGDADDFDARGLETMRERAAQLHGLIRTYGPTLDDVLARRTEAAEVVGAADGSDTLLSQARDRLEAADKSLAAAASALSEARAAAAPRLAAALTEQMSRLMMGSASIEVSCEHLERDAWGPRGADRVELLYRPGSGMEARPLARIASGGEISRVMLAAKVVLGARDTVDTLVFDEVDAGVGGAAAVALADVIAQLASTHQVIVVTHLAQVAVRADCHYVVSKDEGEGVPHTTLSQVSGDDRVAEVARMLDGSAAEASLAHARELLASSGA